MQEIILLKYGELTLKGLNRGTFESVLKKNIRHALKPHGEFSFSSAQSTAIISGENISPAFSALKKVFGISALSRAAVCEKNMTEIKATAAGYLRAELEKTRSFKVCARRADKAFPLQSPQICEELGEFLLEAFPRLAVDVHTPELEVTVEIREKSAFVRGAQQRGAGGLPVGTSGKALLLLSGGIDSPVAGIMMAKRGLSLAAVHFETPPYTSERARKKVERLSELVGGYAGHVRLECVNLTEFSEKIKREAPEELLTILLRREMMRQAERVARERGCGALITGESLAQVASQTLGGLSCTDAAVSLPVFRPLIGFDKAEIIERARELETYDVSCEPFEDCCVIFTPKHPKTRPVLEEIIAAEERLGLV